MVRVLYIYAGVDREELEKRVAQGTDPDTSFFGFNYVKKDLRIQADYLQIKKSLYKFAGSLFRKYLVLNTVYLLVILHKKLVSYDVIVLTSSAYFNLLFLKSLGLFRRQRFIILNLDLTILLKKCRDKPFSKWLLLRTIKQAERIICLSKAQLTYLEEAGLPSERLIFIPLGVDNHFYKALSSRGEFVLTVGRDVGRDFVTFFEAVKTINYQVVVICSPKNVEGLMDKVPPNVTILFDLPYEELRTYYEKALCFVISTKPDTYLVGSDCPGQTAILDTMAYGRAVIATDNPWFDGYFKEGKHIITVPPEDPQALAQAVTRLITNDVLREMLMDEGRKLIDADCNSKVMGQRITEVILSV